MEELLKQLTPYVQRYLDECDMLNHITATLDDFAGWLFFTIEEEEDAQD